MFSKSVHEHERHFSFYPFRKGPTRFLTLRKKDGSEKPRPAMPLTVFHNSLYFIRSLLQRFPVSNRERIDLQPNNKSGKSMAPEPGEF